MKPQMVLNIYTSLQNTTKIAIKSVNIINKELNKIKITYVIIIYTLYNYLIKNRLYNPYVLRKGYVNGNHIKK